MDAQEPFTAKKTFRYKDININYDILGEGNQNLLFIHGFGLTLNSWNEIRDSFDLSEFKLLFIDLKGAGFSSKPKKSDYSINEQAHIVYNLLEHLKMEDVNIIGHSYGGIVTLYLHYLVNVQGYNLNIKKTVLLDTPAYDGITPFFIKILRSPILSFIGLKLFPAGYAARNTINNTFYNKKEARKRLLSRYKYFFKMKGVDYALTQLAKQLIPDNVEVLTQSYEKIDIPFLIIWGENDELIDKKYGVQLAEDIKTSRLEIIPSCGHVPHEERPLETFELINFFLKN
jgi:pimeloyl-ACP methyl ester carboxylesterase